MVKKRSEILAKYDRRFGMIAVDRGYVTAKQLKESLSEQVDDDLACRPHRYLGDIFFEKNLITPNQIMQVLDEIAKDKIKPKGAVSGPNRSEKQ